MNLKLKMKILEKNLKQWDVSQAVGISDSHLSKIIHQQRTPDLKTKESIARVLQCEVSEIFSE